MPDFTWILIAAAVLFVGLQVMQFLMVVTRLLRIPMTDARITPLDDQPELEPDQTAALEELEALGFHPVAWAYVEANGTQGPNVILRHETEPHLAELTFICGTYADYPTAFYSFDAAGEMLVSVNRSAWFTLFTPTDVTLLDAQADSPAVHWQFHRSKAIGAVETDDVTALSKIRRYAETTFERLQDNAAVNRVGGAWYLTLGAAMRMAAALRRMGKTLKTPYKSAAIDGEHRSLHFAKYYDQMERLQSRMGTRRDIKFWVLGLSLAVSLVGWGLVFGWAQAVVLIVVLLFHESGHAVAMRLFGYRDMHMLFVPMLGAVVSGSARELAGWKQAVILLAGPMPGLLLGIAAMFFINTLENTAPLINWQMAAMMAILINLFNLLPITPLDGGQLVELALFRRWPRVRFAFYVISVAAFVALALWIEGTFMWVLVMLIALTIPTQSKLSKLHMRWPEGLAQNERVAKLYEVSSELFGSQNIIRRYGLVKNAIQWHSIKPARFWESAAIIALIGAIWASTFFVIYGDDAFAEEWDSAPDDRTSAQIAFDDAFSNEEWDFSTLETLAVRLDDGDPRRVDMAISRVFDAEPTERDERYADVLRRGRDGAYYALEDVAEFWLSDIYNDSLNLPALQRAARLEDGIARIDQLTTEPMQNVDITRLRIAAAYDEAGDREHAARVLDAIDREIDSTCSERRSQLVNARAWFHIDHGQPLQAIDAIQGSTCAADIDEPVTELGFAYAWALLEVGDIESGLDQMRRVSHFELEPPTWWQRLRGQRTQPAYLSRPLELAHALVAAGQIEEAKRVVSGRNGWQCSQYTGEDDASLKQLLGPWSSLRIARLRETAGRVCPSTVGQCGPTQQSSH